MQIAVASANFQMGEISRLNKLAERVTEIQAIQQRLEQELASLVAELNQPSPTGGPPTTQANPESNRHFARVSTGSPLLLGPVAISID